MKSYAQEYHSNGSSSAPPPYSPYADSSALQAHDPRRSSEQSLLPDDAPEGQHRRRLLLVYIHGFQGNETSFQSFPAHVHNLVKITLAETHVIHTKIYPKYKTRKAIDFPRDDFSRWLAPHESPETDVILLGHSMGGLLAAEVVLLTPYSQATGHAFRHRILGTINFDVPFLGMHPGVVASGLGSIFRPADKTNKKESGNTGSLGRADTISQKPTDPNYNPEYANDVRIPVRKGWASTMHFINKHSDGLIKAGKQYVSSHLEFGGVMADYPGLKRRYNNIRSLEEEDEARRTAATGAARATPRVRFVNYYTASSGRPKRPKSPRPSDPGHPVGVELQNLSLTSTQSLDTLSTQSIARGSSPRISVDEHRGSDIVPHTPIVDKSPTGDVPSTLNDTLVADAKSPSLPPIPPMPREPNAIDEEQFANQAELDLARKAYAREVKAYKRQLEDRDEAIKDREEFEDKLRRDASHGLQGVSPVPHNGPEEDIGVHAQDKTPIQHQDSGLSDSLPRSAVEPPLSQLDSASVLSSGTDQASVHAGSTHEDKKRPKRDKVFCMLPPKDPQGTRDPTWVRVYMEGVDEVGAHCGLFFLGDTYEQLVGEVSARIESWVGEDMTRRYLETFSDS